MWRRASRRLRSQRQSFRNRQSSDIEIMVEPIPDRYVLRPNQTIEIEAEYYEGMEPFTVETYDGGLWISPAIVPSGVWIDGAPAETDWKSPGPNAVA